jgi:hypothetical protein
MKKQTFYHNKHITVTSEKYAYVREYKKQLVQNIHRLFEVLQIRYVIAHGNLIEYERGEPLFHDDDVDIRFCFQDLEKWFAYCRGRTSNEIEEYNLRFSLCSHSEKWQTVFGTNATLIRFENPNNIPEFHPIRVVVDVVCERVFSSFWIDYSIDFSQVRTVRYLDVETYAPSKDDTCQILKKEYGERYMIPDRPPIII